MELTAETITREETMSEISNKEIAKRKRAMRYESLLGDRARLRKRTEALAPRIKRLEDEERALIKLNQLARTLDPETRSNFIGLPIEPETAVLAQGRERAFDIPAGLSLLDLLPRVIDGALIAHRQSAERTNLDYAHAVEDLAKCELALSTEFPNHQE